MTSRPQRTTRSSAAAAQSGTMSPSTGLSPVIGRGNQSTNNATLTQAKGARTSTATRANGHYASGSSYMYTSTTATPSAANIKSKTQVKTMPSTNPRSTTTTRSSAHSTPEYGISSRRSSSAALRRTDLMVTGNKDASLSATLSVQQTPAGVRRVVLGQVNGTTPAASVVARPRSKLSAVGGAAATPATVNRKSALSRDSIASTGTVTTTTIKSHGMESYNAEKEPIKAYLRIRPPPPGISTSNYIKVVNENEVLMMPPADHRLAHSNTSSSLFSGPLLRASALQLDPASHPTQPVDAPPTPTASGSTCSTTGTLYKFTSVFAPDSNAEEPASSMSGAHSQAAFFRATTLPLVHDFVGKGENCLLFAYGPTGSGKTWTVQGGQGAEASGILPRVMDVVWRSLQHKGAAVADESGTGPLRQKKGSKESALSAAAPLTSTPNAKMPAGRGLGVAAGDARRLSSGESEGDDALPEVVPVDDNFTYSIWVSYAEIYNEKIYDLLESPVPSASNVSVSSSSTTTNSSSSMFSAGLGLFGIGGAKAKAMFKGVTTVKRNALSLKHDKGGSGNKYVHGMKEVRVHSAEEARAILDRGQVNRRVYGTLANRASSRSHSIFTIKIVKTRKASPREEYTSRFSIVDLAGSERVTNTGTTGDRLKEAGNINKSLMVLGQCMEVLRRNQERDKSKKPAIVPFRHSKLTELFQSFFVGDGKAAMIVNVNPYETSYDENSHVMKFSAVAKGVMTVKNNTPIPTILPPLPASAVDQATPPRRELRIVRLSMIEGGEEEDVIYEEEDAEDGDEEEDEFVNALLDELSALRTALFESQMETVMAESQARARTVAEYEQKMLDMERHYQERMRDEALEAEEKLNAKLDILTRLQAGRAAQAMKTANPATPSTVYDDSDEEGESEESEDDEGESEDGSERVTTGEASFTSEATNEQDAQVADMLLAVDGEVEADTSLAAESNGTASPSPSPLAVKTNVRNAGLASRLGLKPHLSSPLARSDIDEESVDDLDAAEVTSPRNDENPDASQQSFDVPLVDEEEDDASDARASEDEYEVPLADDEHDDDDQDDFEPDREKSTSNKDKKTPIAGRRSHNHVTEVTVAVKTAVLAGVVNADEEPYEEPESMALDKSMVIRPGTKTKPKRKLGGNRVKDAESIEAIADELAPGLLVRSVSTKSFGSIRR